MDVLLFEEASLSLVDVKKTAHNFSKGKEFILLPFIILKNNTSIYHPW